MKCCICGKEIKEGFGNNPYPITKLDGSPFHYDDCCCNECDQQFVIPARLLLMKVNQLDFVKKLKEVQVNALRNNK